MKQPKISIVIAVEKMNGNLHECLSACEKLDYPDFEVCVFTSTKIEEKYEHTKFFVNEDLKGQPAKKRDEAIKYAKGEILAFIDDDAYPDKYWLKNAIRFFENEEITGVCGPGVTPKNEHLLERVGGWVWSTWIGAGGAGTYRCLPKPRRFVDDYPTFNLLVRKVDFEKVGGFDSNYWPGEDTKLCLDLINLGKKILYDPNVVVNHHRRPIFEKHLIQLGRYGFHRGFFARTLPKTSRRIGYFIPSIFTFFFLLGLPLSIMYRYIGTEWMWWGIMGYLGVMSLYLFILILSAVQVLGKEKNLLIAFLFLPAVFATHLEYGIQFIRGFFAKELKK